MDNLINGQVIKLTVNSIAVMSKIIIVNTTEGRYLIKDSYFDAYLPWAFSVFNEPDAHVLPAELVFGMYENGRGYVRDLNYEDNKDNKDDYTAMEDVDADTPAEDTPYKRIIHKHIIHKHTHTHTHTHEPDFREKVYKMEYEANLINGEVIILTVNSIIVISNTIIVNTTNGVYFIKDPYFDAYLHWTYRVFAEPDENVLPAELKFGMCENGQGYVRDLNYEDSGDDITTNN